MKIKTFYAFLTALLLMGGTLHIKAQEVSAMQAPKVVSPEVSLDNSVTFRVFPKQPMLLPLTEVGWVLVKHYP
jgi:hypothetical protein